MWFIKPKKRTAKAPDSTFSNKQRLDNVVNGAKLILQNDYIAENYALHPIFNYVKVFTDKITAINAVNAATLSSGDSSRCVLGELNGLMFSNNNDALTQLFGTQKAITPLSPAITVQFSLHPVIAWPWKKDNLITNIQKISSSGTEWRQQSGNHFITLFYPMGVCHVDSGQHSIFSGKLSSRGSVVCSQAIDFRIFYEQIYFDGDFYRYHDGSELAPAKNFEFGCIFEIGREILKHPHVCFADVKPK